MNNVEHGFDEVLYRCAIFKCFCELSPKYNVFAKDRNVLCDDAYVLFYFLTSQF